MAHVGAHVSFFITLNFKAMRPYWNKNKTPSTSEWDEVLLVCLLFLPPIILGLYVSIEYIFF